MTIAKDNVPQELIDALAICMDHDSDSPHDPNDGMQGWSDCMERHNRVESLLRKAIDKLAETLR